MRACSERPSRAVPGAGGTGPGVPDATCNLAVGVAPDLLHLLLLLLNSSHAQEA